MNMVLESEMTMQSMVLLCSAMNVSRSVIPAVKGMVSITLRTLSGLTSWLPGRTETNNGQRTEEKAGWRKQ